MSAKVVYGYKDLSTKVIFLFTGIVLLACLNALPIAWIKYPTFKRYILGVTLIFAWIFYRMWRILSKLHYLFDSNGDITIVLPNKKKFTLAHDLIISQQQIPKLSRRSGRGVKYLPRNKEFHFTTSNSHLLKLIMKDGRSIVISPKDYPG